MKDLLERSIGRRAAHGGRARRRLPTVALAAVALLAAFAPAALAAPKWRVDPLSTTTAAPGDTLHYIVQLTNVGDEIADGTTGDPMTFTATLPPGLTALGASSFSNWDCSSLVVGDTTFTCTNSSDILPANELTQVFVDVAVDGAASGRVTARFDVSGGGAGLASSVDPTTITPDLPSFGVDAFDGQTTADATGTPFTQAGGHPYAASTSIDVNTIPNAMFMKGTPWPVEPVKNVLVDLPPGFVGNPTGVTSCTLAELANSQDITPQPLCPPTSQVGVTLVRTNVNNAGAALGPFPVFNMEPPADSPARFGFNVAGSIVTLDVKVRSDSDYGVTAVVSNVPEGIAMTGTTLTLWGVPADPSHDAERACAGRFAPSSIGAPHCTSGAPLTAFLRNPTSCTPDGEGLPTTLHTDSWVDPGDFKEATFFSHLPNAYPFPPDAWGPQQGTTGCDRVPFRPTVRAEPTSAIAGKPSAFSFDVSLPQTDDPSAIGQGDLKKAVVTLPLGMRVNPSSAAGLTGCSPGEVKLHSTADASCPPSSKIGTVTIDTPLLERPIEGSVYLAGPHDNPFDTLLALYIVAKSSGVVIKLPGKVESDPLSGQLTTMFDDNPQLPFSNLHLQFKGGSQAPIVNPAACGTYATVANLTSWSGATVVARSDFTISRDGNGAPCPSSQFTPGFSAGTESSAAGTTSPLHVRMTRDDEDEQLSTVAVDSMPAGLTAYVSRVDLCKDADAAKGTCGDASKIGRVTVGAGAGPDPFYITAGRVYLTGPYRGAPFGLSIVVPAVAGPFNLGDVNVRGAVFIDKHTAQLRIDTQPLPTILEGIPLDVRDVRVAVDRAGFSLNPTSCAEMAFHATLGSTGGKQAAVSDRFQAADCGSLGFKPRMVMRVGGRGHTRRGQTSPFSTTLTMPQRNQANLRFVRVTLPQTINARLNTINDACTRAEFENEIKKCAHAVAGSAVASTPLLRAPLKGSVYFVKNGHPIPDLFVALRGQVDFDLIGRVTIPGGKRLATTFDAAPDVPIRSFRLSLLGGPRTASIGAAKNLCSASARRAKAQVDYIGQNGKVLQVDQALGVAGCGKQKRHRGRR